MMTSEPAAQVSLTISCQSLPRGDMMSQSDPYCQLYCRNEGNASWLTIGRSETIRNTSNPVFAYHFIAEFRFEREQQFLIRVFDDDFGQGQDDFLGECEFKLGTLMGSRGQIAVFPLLNGRLPRSDRARATLRAEQLETDTNAGALHLTLAGRNFDKKDGLFGKADPYFELLAQKANGEMVLAHRSEHVVQNLNPKWNPCTIPMSSLQSATGQLRLSVTDWDADGTHDLIGSADLRLDDLLHLAKNIPLIHPPTKSKYTKSSYVNSGLVDVIEAWVEQRYTFVQYLRGGLQIGLMIAIDFTGSNGDPRKPGTNHYGSGMVPNNYTEALQAVGSICLEYDSDKAVQAFGFGAKPSQYEPNVSHCFPLTGTGGSEFVYGIDGVMAAYQNCFQRGVVLFGPTNFAPVIRRCTEIAMAAANTYSVLLILTDGEITDMADTVDALVNAATNAPLSIVIVGVGAADFSSMRQLDGDYQPLVSSRGVRCPRDIVQFVPFNQFKGHADALAAETLKEIPHQVTDYFALKRIVPQAAIEIPLPTGEELPMAQVVAPPPPPRPTSPPSAQVGKALFMGAVDSNQYYRV